MEGGGGGVEGRTTFSNQIIIMLTSTPVITCRVYERINLCIKRETLYERAHQKAVLPVIMKHRFNTTDNATMARTKRVVPIECCSSPFFMVFSRRFCGFNS